MALKDYLEKGANVVMGGLETIDAPFQIAGEAIRGAGESEPLKFATAADPSGFRLPSIVQRLAPSTRTPQPPADAFTKTYQGLEGIAHLPYGLKTASNVVTGQPDLAAVIGGMGLGLGLMPPVAKKMASMEMPEVPKALRSERGAVALGKAEPYFPPGSPEREANFAKWFGKSKVVDESGKPIEVYHGTTHRFDTFSPQKANVENHYGKAHYFTDSLDDVNANYAGEGPDLTSRIERRTEQLYDELYPGESFQYNSPDYKAAQDRARMMAKKELSGGTPSVMPVNLKLKNPVILDGPNETNFRINYNERTGKESGSGLKLYNALIDEAQAYGEDGQKLWGEVMDKLGGDPEFTAKQFEDAFRSSESISYLTDESGDLASNDLLRKVYQKAGFDGVIMDADKAFGGQRKSGKPMEMDWDTKHYIAFEPTQIKSTIGNRGTFNPRDPNITHAVPVAAGVGAAGAAADAQAEEQPLSEGGIVEEESDMPFQNEFDDYEEEIPDGVMNQGRAGDWRDEMADHLGQRYGGQDQSQNMARGGIAGMYDVDLGDTPTARGAAYERPANEFSVSDLKINPDLFGSQLPANTAPVEGPVFNPQAGLPPRPAPSAALVAPIPSPAAPAGPDPLQAYLAQKKQMMNRYGPEEQAAMEQSIDKQRRGLVPNLALGATGLADAIMQGVARAGSGNFQANLQNRMDKTQEGQRQAFESGRAGNMARIKQDMEFAKVDPDSALSRSVQRANQVTLQRMGYRPEDIALISADSMSDVLSKRLSLEEIRSRAELAKAVQENTSAYQMATLGLAGHKQTYEEGKDVKEEQAREEAQQSKIAGEALDRDKAGRIAGMPLLPSPVSREERRAARNIQRKGLGLPTRPGATANRKEPEFQTEDAVKNSGLPKGSIIRLRGKRFRID